MTQHFMLLPSLACQAQCSYCFGPNRGPIMQQDVFTSTVDWIASYGKPGESVEITFHGGEPLLAGKEWYRQALPVLQQRFEGRIKLGIQSNLWLLDDEFCALFREYGVSIGTSLDGPETINDAQRGKGYFKQTMAGIETARRNGLSPGVICTFTRLSAPHYRDIFEFFADRGLSFSVHESVCTLGDGNDKGLALAPEEAEGLMVDLFNYYLENITRAKISTFDSMARGLSAQNGGICTFGDCLGKYLTIGPRGEIFSCNRFAYHPEWQIGSVFDQPSEQTLAQSPVWQKLHQRELTVQEDCGDCAHFDYCKGGCPYNAFTSGIDRRDSHCQVYRRLFDHIGDRALEEVFSEENMEAIVQHGPGKNGLMRKGRLTQVMKDGPHPQDVARKARETVAAVALACSDSPEDALEKLDNAGIITQRDAALGSLRFLRQRLDGQSQQVLVNAYLHVTYACNLTCSHCYAQAGAQKNISMQVDEVERLAREAVSAGFKKLVITGGEPLVHPRRDALLDALAGLRQTVKPMQIVLRTNLAYSLSAELAKQILRSVDQIVVSVDGDEASHDARRGADSYRRTVENLRTLQTSEVSIAATLTAAQMDGAQGQAARALADELNLSLRFKPVLPLGRAAGDALTPEFYTSLDDESELLSLQANPRSTCGLGMNLYVAPDGESYPCYALMGAGHNLGNVLNDGLAGALERNNAYRRVTVDSNRKCGQCDLRYLCGGFCRAWGSNADPDSPPTDCAALYEQARGLLLSALVVLDVSVEQWQAAGLPLLVPDFSFEIERSL